MSLQKGNVSRTRPQKHKNRNVFKNDLHDKTNQIKMINSLQVSDVCVRCKEIIEWKIKYKKYKPLKQPKTCVKCSQKTVRQAYHVMCRECGLQLGVCTKCCQKKDIVEAQPTKKEQITLDNELKQLIKSLPERKRRTFLRYIEQKSKNDNKDEPDVQTEENSKKELLKKLEELKIGSTNSDEEDDDFNDDYEFEDEDESEGENSDVS